MKENEYETYDAKISERIKNGDEQAFREVYDTYHHRLFHFSLKFTHCEEATQEIIQDIFLKLWSNRHNLKPHLSLQNYLFTLNKHANFKYLQQAAQHSSLQLELVSRYETSRSYTEDEVIYQEYIEIAEDAINHLPAQRKLIFRMFRFEGYSSKEIAELLGISNHTVRAQLVKATQYIKEQFFIRTGITLTLLWDFLAFLF